MNEGNGGGVGIGGPVNKKQSVCRVAVTGIGNMGSYHAKQIYDGQVKGLSLAAVCDTNSDRLDWARKDLPGVACFSSHEELLASGLADAVIIATPHYFHCPIAIDCFHAGRHVLCEKPAGVYASQVEEMNAAAQKAGTVFSIMFNQRTEPLYREAKRLTDSGVLGRLQRLSWVVTTWYRTQAYYNSSSWRATWAGEGGGVLLNQAVHNLDLWQWIYGMPSSLIAFCGFGKYHDIEVEDDVTIHASYEDGRTAVFVTSTGEYPGTNRLEITGEKGKLVAENGMLTWWRNNGDNTETWAQPVAIPIPQEPVGHLAILQNFADAIQCGTPLIAPGQEGLRSLQITNAAYLSAWENRVAELPVDPSSFCHQLQEHVAHGRKIVHTASPVSDGNLSRRWEVRW